MGRCPFYWLRSEHIDSLRKRLGVLDDAYEKGCMSEQAYDEVLAAWWHEFDEEVARLRLKRAEEQARAQERRKLRRAG